MSFIQTTGQQGGWAGGGANRTILTLEDEDVRALGRAVRLYLLHAALCQHPQADPSPPPPLPPPARMMVEDVCRALSDLSRRVLSLFSGPQESVPHTQNRFFPPTGRCGGCEPAADSGLWLVLTEPYRYGTNVPPLPENVHLDFNSRDETGAFCTPEGSFRSMLLSSASLSTVHVVSGMAGVGKTAILCALGHDPLVQQHFPDGILFMSLGADASEGHVVQSLSKIMSVTGSMHIASEVQRMIQLPPAIEFAANWFQEKRVLFLIDDIWPTNSKVEGFLPDLKGILEKSPNSCIAASTRIRPIGARIGSHFEVEARDPRSHAAISMFMMNVTARSSLTFAEFDMQLPAVRGIIALCAGLPVALAVTGRGVSSYLEVGLGWDRACSMYLADLQRAKSIGHTILGALVSLSLEYVEHKRLKNQHLISSPLQYTVREMFASLCVVPKQHMVPVSALARMWEIDEAVARELVCLFSSVNLANVSRETLADGRTEHKVRIFDLHLDYCRQEAARFEQSQLWHVRMNLVCGGGRSGVSVAVNVVSIDRPPSRWEDEASSASHLAQCMIEGEPRSSCKAIDDACHLLSAVNSFARGLFPVLVANTRNLEKAKNVSDAFKACEMRLRPHSRAAELMPSQQNMVRGITRHARESLKVLKQDENISRALDRAYENCATIEGYLRELVRSLGPASAAVEPLQRATGSLAQKTFVMSNTSGVSIFEVGDVRVAISVNISPW